MLTASLHVCQDRFTTMRRGSCLSKGCETVATAPIGEPGHVAGLGGAFFFSRSQTKPDRGVVQHDDFQFVFKKSGFHVRLLAGCWVGPVHVGKIRPGSRVVSANKNQQIPLNRDSGHAIQASRCARWLQSGHLNCTIGRAPEPCLVAAEISQRDEKNDFVLFLDPRNPWFTSIILTWASMRSPRLAHPSKI